MLELTPYQYRDTIGRVQTISPYQLGIDDSRELSDSDKEALAAEARRLDRRYALIRSIAAMYNAGERVEMRNIILMHCGDDIRCL